MKVLVTGASGFVGRALVHRLLASDLQMERLTLVDLHLPDVRDDDDRVRDIGSNIADPAVRARALEGGVDLVFHLAGISSAISERDYALSKQVNLDATLALFEDAARAGSRPRVVCTSSIAVFGAPLPAHVDDDTPAEPALIYGAHKRMCEVALADFSRRGEIEGIALRPSGILARPYLGPAKGAGFLSDIFHAFVRNEPFVSPVSREAHSWVISIERCVDNLLHAAQLAPEAMPATRVLTMPALRVTIPELAASLTAATGRNADLVSYEPQEWIETVYGSYPPLETAFADRLGFRNDGDAAALVKTVLASLNA